MLICFLLHKNTQNYKKVYSTLLIYREVDIIKDLIKLKKASEIIGISYKTLYSWVSNNEVSYTKIGKRYYMTQEQLNDLVFSYTKN